MHKKGEQTDSIQLTLSVNVRERAEGRHELFGPVFYVRKIPVVHFHVTTWNFLLTPHLTNTGRGVQRFISNQTHLLMTPCKACLYIAPLLSVNLKNLSHSHVYFHPSTFTACVFYSLQDWRVQSDSNGV